MDKDKITTIMGAVVAAATAAEPVVNATQGTFHSQDWVQLVTAVAFAVWGFFTSRKKGSVPAPAPE